MSASEIDRYLEQLDEPKRSTLSQLRSTILDIVPDAEQCISYGVPAADLSTHSKSSGALRFDIDTPLPRDVVEKLIAVRIKHAFPA